MEREEGGRGREGESGEGKRRGRGGMLRKEQVKEKVGEANKQEKRGRKDETKGGRGGEWKKEGEKRKGKGKRGGKGG